MVFGMVSIKGTERQVFTFKKTFLFTLLNHNDITSLIHTISFDASHEDFFETVRQLIDSHKQKLPEASLEEVESCFAEIYGGGWYFSIDTIDNNYNNGSFSLSIMNFINKVSFIGSKVEGLEENI